MLVKKAGDAAFGNMKKYLAAMSYFLLCLMFESFCFYDKIFLLNMQKKNKPTVQFADRL